MKTIVLCMFILILLLFPKSISGISCLYNFKQDNAFLSSYSNLNQPPENVSIDGPVLGNTGTYYEYSFYCDDPEDDEVYYYIKWGTPSCPAIYGPFSSSTSTYIGFIWEKRGTYNITVKAVDINGAESDIVSLYVRMPHYFFVNRVINVYQIWKNHFFTF